MSTSSPNAGDGNRATAPYRTNPGQEASEQLLALADKIGGAYAEAYQQLNAAYSAAFQKLAVGMAGVQGGMPDPQALSAMMDPSSLTDRVDGRWVYVGSALLGGLASFAFTAFAHGFVVALVLRLLGG